MAMARTGFSPRGWPPPTPGGRAPPVRWSVLVVSSALWMAGRWPSNSTSTTAPMICTRRPVATPLGAIDFGAAALGAAAVGAAALGAALVAAGFLGVVAMGPDSLRILERLGAGDDLDQLL